MATQLPEITPQEQQDVSSTNYSSGNPSLDAKRSKAIAMSQRDAAMLDKQGIPEGPMPSTPAPTSYDEDAVEFADSPQEEDFEVKPSDIQNNGGTIVSPNLSGEYALQTAYLNSETNGSPFLQQALDDFHNSKGKEEEKMADEATAAYKQKEEEDYKQAYGDTLGNPFLDTQDGIDNAQAANEAIQEVRKKPSQEILMDVIARPEISTEIKKQQAADRQVALMAHKIIDDMGYGDWIRNIGGLLIPFKQTYENISTTGKVIDPEDWAKRFVQSYRDMSPEDQMAALPGIERWLKSELPELRQAEFLNALVSATGSQDLSSYNNAWFFADLAGTSGEIAGAFKLGKKLLGATNEISKANRIISIDAKIGNGHRAADAVTAGIISEGDIKAVNQAKTAMQDFVARRTELRSQIDSIDKEINKLRNSKKNSRNPKIKILGKQKAELKNELDNLREEKVVGATDTKKEILQEKASALPKLTYETVRREGRGDVLPSMGLDQSSAANTASPFVTAHIGDNSIDGLDVPMNDRINKYNHLVDQAINNAREAWRPGLLSKSQRELMEGELANKYKEMDGVTNVLVKSDKDKFHITYDEVDKSGKVTRKGLNETYTAKLEDTGTYTLNDPGLTKQFFLSPSVLSKGTSFAEEGRTAQLVDQIQALHLKNLRNLHRKALETVIGKHGFKGLLPWQRRKLAKIDSVLMQGDKDGVVYSIDELKSGILGVELSDDEVEAYYKLRTLMDGSYYMRNALQRDKMLAQNLKSFKFAESGDDAVHYGRPYSRAQDAKRSIEDSGKKMYYDSESGEYRNLSNLDLDEEYASGRQLVKLHKAEDINKTGNQVFYAMVNTDEVRELPLEVLAYRTGYVPKINDTAQYFVRVARPSVIDGEHIPAVTSQGGQNQRANLEVVRVFDNKKEANIFREQEQAKAAAEGKTPEQESYEVYENRELEKHRVQSGLGESFGGDGGLFTGRRASKEILQGLDGVPQDRVNSFEAISRYLSNLARHIPRNEWRMALQEKAVNTANRLFAGGNERFASFQSLNEVADDTEKGRMVKYLYNQINDWNGVPTKEELLFQNMVQRVIDSSFGHAIGKKGKKALFYLKQKDPIGAARATAFHGLLGWFNPVQMWVQAQGVAVSASMNILNPANLTRVVRDQFALQVLQHMRQTPEQIAHVAKSTGMDLEYLKGLHSVWKRSGLYESVLATADHAAAAGGRGVAVDALSRASDAGLFFYRSGELLNRRFALATAFREWFDAAGKDLSKLGTNDFESIAQRANDLMLNLNKGNRAAWQRGFFSLPLQFNQISQKTIESVLGLNGAFNKAERSKLVFGQVALYGAAGIPLGNLGAGWVAEMLGYDQKDIEEKMSPEMRKTLNEGFLGWLTMAATGVDMDVGQRSSLVGGIEQLADRMMFDESTIVEKALGAFGSVNTGFWDGMNKSYALFSTGLAYRTPIDLMKAVSNPFLKAISSANNLEKAMFMHDWNRIVDKHGNQLINRDFDPMEEMTQALGFRLTEEADIWRADSVIKGREQYIDMKVNQVLDVIYSAATESFHGGLSPERSREAQEAMAVLLQGMNPKEYHTAVERIQNKLKDTSTKRGKVWKKYREINAEGNADNFINWYRLLEGNFAQLRGAMAGGGILQESGHTKDNTNEAQ